MRRRGKKKAIVAVAHDILVTAWHLLSRDQPYCDPGPTVLQERTAEQLRRRAIRQLERLGHSVTLEAV
jgi:hypothetical protein